MKSQEQREGDAVVIVIALLGLAAVAVLGVVSFELVSSLTRLVDHPVGNVLWLPFWVLVACAAVAPLRYLYRHRRP